MAMIVGGTEQIIERGRPVTVNDPACGSGGMFLRFAKQLAPTAERKESHVDLMRATCQDVSPTACDMAYVNTTLWGIPAHIIQGNTLTMEIQNDWKNIHWHRVGEDQRQAILQMQRLLSAGPDGDSESIENVQIHCSDPGDEYEQPEFKFE